MPRPYISVSKRRVVIERVQGRCEYCQSLAAYATETFVVDPSPLSRGGKSEQAEVALNRQCRCSFVHQEIVQRGNKVILNRLDEQDRQDPPFLTMWTF